jgi:hypothetical protein
MKIFTVVVNAMTVLLLFSAIYIRQHTYNIFAAERLPGFHRVYIDGDDGSMRMLKFALVLSIVTLGINIFKKKDIPFN